VKSEFLKFLNKSIENLAETGAENPKADVEIIFSEATGIPIAELRICGKTEISEPEKNKIVEILKRRSSGEPLQYILGKAYFRDLCLDVGPGALIPRPETEILVDEAIKAMPRGAKVCDVGVGSGAIILSIAHERSDCDALGIEISEDALKWARKNLEKYKLKNVRLTQGDLLDSEDDKFDVITANLPYVCEYEYNRLQKEVRDYEPQTALLAEDEGMAVIKKLIKQAPARLKENGCLIIEFDPAQAEALEVFFKEESVWREIKQIDDLCGKTRFIKAVPLY
jgi:release factor glutamine methyltransferase